VESDILHTNAINTLLGFRHLFFLTAIPEEFASSTHAGLYATILRQCNAKFDLYFSKFRDWWDDSQMFNAPSLIQNKFLINSMVCPSIDPSLSGEWVRYIEMLRASDIVHVGALEWWEMRSNYLPKLYVVAIAHITVPITSASVERCFSIVTSIIRPQRNQLSSESILAELFQRYNSHQYYHFSLTRIIRLAQPDKNE